MGDGRVSEQMRGLVPRPLREVPADLALVLVLVAIADLSVTLPVIRSSPIRVIFGLLFVLFLPGYAVIAALFPEKSSSLGADGDSPPSAKLPTEISGIERFALSMVLSVLLSPTAALLLNFTAWGINLLPLMTVMTVFTVGAVAVAIRRRRDLPADERFSVPLASWTASLRNELFEAESRGDALLNAFLVVAILAAAVSAGVSAVGPNQEGRYSELYLLTESEDGDLVFADYPSEVKVGQPQPITVMIGNHERRPENYTVVVVLYRDGMEGGSNAGLELDQLEAPTLPHNMTWTRNYDIVVPVSGNKMRLAFLLYRGQAPTDPSVETAYRRTVIPINATLSE